MEIFQTVISYLRFVPDWVPLIALPAAVILLAVLFTAVGGRRAYLPLALALGALGFAFVCAKDSVLAPVYLGLFSLVAALFSLLFLIPKRRGEKQETSGGGEDMFKKFYEPLTERPFSIEEEESAGESGAELGYADELMKKLRAAKLSAGDRLEAEELSNTLNKYRGRPLNGQEKSALNDCLACVLRLTAKYAL